MKIIPYKLVVLLLLIPVISFASDHRGRYKKVKKVSKTYHVSADNTLNINNKFGNVDITTWEENTIQIDVKITVSGNDEEALTEQLKKINITFNQEGNQVFASTHIGKKKSNSFFSNWLGWTSNSNSNFQIDYQVKMPISNNLDITNDYGTIVLNELNGKSKINCDYGKIIIGNLNNKNNKINIDYTTNSNFDFVNEAHINADFSKFTIEKGNMIKVQADYTTSNYGEIKELEYDCDYGNINIDSVENIYGNSSYTTIKIGDLSNSANINSKFSGVKIRKILKGFKNIIIKSGYTNVKVGIDGETSAKLTLDARYGNISYDGELFNFNKILEKTSLKTYNGYFNEKNSQSTIKISTEYGGIKLYQK